MLRVSRRLTPLLSSCLSRNIAAKAASIKTAGIALDIDGVLRKGNFAIPNAARTIKLLKTPLSRLSPKFKGVDASVPFVLMTNGGGYLEEYKARELNQILGLTKEEECVKPEDMILCHTPLREIANEYKNDYVIVAGLGDLLSISHEYGFSKAITLDEYSALFPYLSRLSILGKTKEHVQYLAERARKRLGFKPDLKVPPPVKALFMLADPTMWEENLQITCDLLISRDGVPGSVRKQGEPQFVKFYMTNPDFIYSDAFVLPRFAQGCFLICLQEVFKRRYGFTVETITYGKPMARTFQYAERLMKKRYGKYFDLHDFYMIGDNPEGDARGANENNWKSILVKTGLFKGPANDPYNPATYVKEDALEAVTHILKLEGIIRQSEDVENNRILINNIA